MRIIKVFMLAMVTLFSLIVSSCENAIVEDAKVESVIISSARLTKAVGQTAQLTVMILPENATVISGEWSVDNDNVKIDQEGLLTALKVGTSVVTYTADGISAQCDVEVVPDEIPVEGVVIVPDHISVNYMKYAYLDYGLIPKNATDERVTWKSDDESVVLVDQNGRIQGVALGDANVTVTTANGKSATCSVTVVGKRVEDLELVYTGTDLSVDEMEYQAIKHILPADASDKTINWRSQDESIVTVEWSEEQQYAILKGIHEGFTNVEASPVSNPEIVEFTWVKVGPKTGIPYRIGRNWVLIDCQFSLDGETQMSESEYMSYLQENESMSAETASQRIDMLERYLSYDVHNPDAMDYLILTITTEEGNVYEGQSTYVAQFREGDLIFNYEADFDLNSAPQEIQDRFSIQVYELDPNTNEWTYPVNFEEYGVNVTYIWKHRGESILDKD